VKDEPTYDLSPLRAFATPALLAELERRGYVVTVRPLDDDDVPFAEPSYEELYAEAERHARDWRPLCGRALREGGCA
jgi:hypothetical protein